MAVLVVAAGRPQHPIEREIAQGIHPEELADLLGGVRRGDELLARGSVDAVQTGSRDRRRAEAEMHLARARSSDHLDQALAGVAAHEAVVHHHDRLALDDVAHRIELDLHLGHPVVLGGIDEGASDVVVPDETILQLDAGDLGEAERHGVRAVGDAENDLAPRRRLLAGQLPTQLAARAVHRLPEDRAVGPGEVDQLEDAPAHRPGR